MKSEESSREKNSSALRRMDLDFPVGAMVRNLPANPGDAGLIPGSERSPGLENDYPLQHSCLENSKDRGDWQTTSPWSHKESGTIGPLSMEVNGRSHFYIILQTKLNVQEYDFHHFSSIKCNFFLNSPFY